MINGPRPPSVSDPITPPPVLPAITSRRLSGSLPQFVVESIGEHPLGFGGYSDVWKAKMIFRDGGVTSLVALKVLRLMGSDSDKLRRCLDREVRCWKLADHENIAAFYGVVYQSNGAPALVLPWYENGCVDKYLQRHPSVDPIKTILEIASGIEYLHGMGIVHGDLKAANVMIDDEGHVKLIDFGLSRLIGSEEDVTTATGSSTRWCAPELLCSGNGRPTKASDVYAFASTALQLLTGAVPYSTINSRLVPLTIIKGTTPRSLSSDLRYSIAHSERFWSILERCWAESALRPSIIEVRSSLQNLYS